MYENDCIHRWNKNICNNLAFAEKWGFVQFSNPWHENSFFFFPLPLLLYGIWIEMKAINPNILKQKKIKESEWEHEGGCYIEVHGAIFGPSTLKMQSLSKWNYMLLQKSLVCHNPHWVITLLFIGCLIAHFTWQSANHLDAINVFAYGCAIHTEVASKATKH